MALQRSQPTAPAPAPASNVPASAAAAAAPAPLATAPVPPSLAPSAPGAGGPALSTRETASRPFVELGIMFGQALGGREPVMQAMTNLQAIGAEHGCDAIIAVKLMHYPTTAGPAVVAYGTGVRFLPVHSQNQVPTPEVMAAAPAVPPPPAAGGRR